MLWIANNFSGDVLCPQVSYLTVLECGMPAINKFECQWEKKNAQQMLTTFFFFKKKKHKTSIGSKKGKII